MKHALWQHTWPAEGKADKPGEQGSNHTPPFPCTRTWQSCRTSWKYLAGSWISLVVITPSSYCSFSSWSLYSEPPVHTSTKAFPHPLKSLAALPCLSSKQGYAQKTSANHSLEPNFRIQEVSNKTVLSLVAWILYSRRQRRLLSIGARGLSKSILFIFSSFFVPLSQRLSAQFHNLSFVQLNTKEIHLAPPPDLFAGVLWKQTLRSALPSRPLLHRIPVSRNYWVPNSHQQHHTRLVFITTRVVIQFTHFYVESRFIDKLITAVRGRVSQGNPQVCRDVTVPVSH